MWAPGRGVCSLSRIFVRRISSYGSAARYAAAENAAVIEEPIEAEGDPKKSGEKKRKPRKKAASEGEKGVKEPEKEPEKGMKEPEKEPEKEADKMEEKSGSDVAKKSRNRRKKSKKSEEESSKKSEKDEEEGQPREGYRGERPKKPGLPPVVLKSRKFLRGMLESCKGDGEILKEKLAAFEGPFSLIGLERAMVGISPEFAVPLFRWAATTRPEFLADPKAVHRFISVLRRRGDKLGEIREFMAKDLEALPIVRAMVYSAVYMGYLNAEETEKAREIAGEMEELGIALHPSSVNRVLLQKVAKDGLDAMMELHRELDSKGWILDSGGVYQVISALCRAGRMDEAIQELFASRERGIEQVEGSYHPLVHSLCDAGRLDDAIRVAESMTKLLEPRTSANPLKHLVNKLAEAGRFEEAAKVLEDLARVAKPINVTLVRVLCEAGELDRAMEVAEMLRRYKCESGFKVLVARLCEAGRVGDAKVVFDAMVEAGVSPDAETCTALAMSSGKAKAKEASAGIASEETTKEVTGEETSKEDNTSEEETTAKGVEDEAFGESEEEER